VDTGDRIDRNVKKIVILGEVAQRGAYEKGGRELFGIDLEALSLFSFIGFNF